MVWEHPSLGIAQALVAKEKRFLQQAEKNSLYAFQPKITVTALKMADAMEGKGSAATSGRANLERWMEGMDFLQKKRGVKLGFMQKQLVEIAQIILVPRMFGDSFAAEQRYLRLKLGMKRKYEQAAVTLPRRAGKTVCQCLLTAVTAVTQPDGNCCCFQLGSRQSKNWLSLTIRMMRMFKGSKFEWKLVGINSKESITIKNCCGTEVTVSSYPGPRDADASNYRGVGDKLMLLLYDEFYFFKEVVYTTSLPLSRNGAAILMISSMSKHADDNISRMINAKLEDDSDFFLKLDWVRACHPCQAKGTANTCDHIERRPERFEPMNSLSRMRRLISPFGKEDFERELMNLAALSKRSPVFSEELLAPLRDRQMDYISPVAIEYPEFFVAIDPAGGTGGFSQTAIVTVVFDTVNVPPGLSYRCLVISTEIVPKTSITTDSLGNWVVRHALAVRQTIPSLRNARAIIVIENNSLLVAQSVVHAISHTPRCINFGYMVENAKQARGATEIDVRAGTRTTNESKERIIGKLRELLWDGGLCFHKNFFVPHVESQLLNAQKARDAQNLFVDELANIHAEVCSSKGPVASQRPGHIKYRGYHPDGSKATDDLTFALGFSLIAYPLYRMNPHMFVRTVVPGGR